MTRSVCTLLFFLLLALSGRPAFAEDTDRQFAGYVSDQETRFKGYVWNFVDEFEDTWSRSQYYWARSYMFGSSHLSYCDSVDLAYFAGHGNASTIWPSSADGSCYLGDKAWGSYSTASRAGDLEYVVFHSCKVLEMSGDWRGRWRNTWDTRSQPRPFAGLHVAMGFRTNHYTGSGAGPWAADEFAENLEDGDSVRTAWVEAVEDALWLIGWDSSKNRAAVFYVRPHANETISQNGSADRRYGDSDYLLDAYYME